MVQQQQHQTPYQLTNSISGSGSAGGAPQRWGLASPTRRRRALEQAASDPDALALLATKLCLAVAPEEAVPQLCLPSSGYQQYGGVRFFVLDCRPNEQLGAGRYVRSMWVHPIQHLITRLSRRNQPINQLINQNQSTPGSPRPTTWTRRGWRTPRRSRGCSRRSSRSRGASTSSSSARVRVIRCAMSGWKLHVTFPTHSPSKPPQSSPGDRSNLVAAPPPATALSPLGGHEKTAAARMREQLQRAAREDVAHLHTAALFLLKVWECGM